MNHRELGRLLIKIAGLFMILSALEVIPSFGYEILTAPKSSTWPQEQDAWLRQLFSSTIHLLIGLFLFAKPAAIINFLTKSDSNTTGESSIKLEPMVLSVAGVWLLATSLGGLFVNLMYWFPVHGDLLTYSSLASALVRPVAGICLMVRPHVVARWLQSMRG